MKKNIFAIVLASVMFTSCGYVGTGALWGGSIGSAVGGLAGGYRGHEVGRLLGMAGGAVVGAAVQESKEKSHARDMEQYQEEKARLAANRRARQNQQTVTTTTRTTTVPENYNFEQGAIQDSGFDSNNGGDDRIDFDFGDGTSSDYGYAGSSVENVEAGAAAPQLVIRNARFVDADGQNDITRGETCTIVFEIFNAGNAPAYNVQPTVVETTGNKHIMVSPSILIESIGAGRGVRYTARVVADKSLKEGVAQFSVAVVQGSDTMTKVVNFTVPTHK